MQGQADICLPDIDFSVSAWIAFFPFEVPTTNVLSCL